MDDPILHSKSANAFFEDVEVAGRMHRDEYGSGAAVSLFKRAMGGLWVGGRVTLTRTQLAFNPNRLNSSMHKGEIDWIIKLSDIESIEVTSSIGMPVTNVATKERRVRFRCWGAKRFVSRIDDQRQRLSRGDDGA